MAAVNQDPAQRQGGVKGLAGGKQVVLALSRGGLYGGGSPGASTEHAETYLRTVLRFIGVNNPEIIVAEGFQATPDRRQAIIDGALRAAEGRVAA